MAKHETLELLAAGSDSPQLDTERLLEFVTGLDRTRQLLAAETPLSASQNQTLETLRTRRLRGEPLAYVLGSCGFWSLELTVTPDVLIPRPETELVVERALQHLPANFATTALDLGTGSGAIALAIAVERPLARLVATDASVAALQVARENARHCGIANVEFALSDWFAAVPPRRYSLIVSNPPYIADDDVHVHDSVRHYEPASALFSGPDGLQALTAITRGAKDFLEPNGWLILEHGWQQAAAVRALLESAGFSSVASHADLAGHARVTEGQLAY